MFVTRATRHDKADILELLATNGWEDSDIDRGKMWIARDGKVAGVVRLVEVAPQTVVVDDMLVREDRRGEGIGRRVLEAAMMGMGGTLYLCCHPEYVSFYEKFGFTEVAPDALLQPVADYFVEVEDLPPPEGHVHHFMSARA
jgi:N-acetylglutamate synthase-like GNAT family acetyltransferase